MRRKGTWGNRRGGERSRDLFVTHGLDDLRHAYWAGIGEAHTIGSTAAAVGGLAGLAGHLKLCLLLRRHAEHDGGLAAAALLFQVRSSQQIALANLN
uniref:Uncharacterized protein n=1 Tax=Leersia perrieri TaxID=77586 RepID=A0A0D9XVQ6_9ORYZ